MEYSLPALRGIFGSWIYYSSMMPLSLIAKKVSNVKDIYQNKALSDMIQRSYNTKRYVDITEYLRSENDRFFNSLVLAVYDGIPSWFPAGILADTTGALLNALPQTLHDSFGFLNFSGTEKIITIDGQHRLGGIVGLGDDLMNNTDLAPVIFVAHDKNDPLRMQRTRRLFTTLNKHAQSVSKKDIIALDENDLMAIITRRLVEENPCFSHGKVKINKVGSNIADGDDAFTSIENIYDILTTLFTKILPHTLPNDYSNRSGRELKNMLRNGRRLSDKWLGACYDHAVNYFSALATIYPELREFFDAPSDNYGEITRKSRLQNKCIAFRPVGLNVITNLIAQLNGTLEERLEQIQSLPKRFSEVPFRGIILTARGEIDEKKEPAVRNLFLYVLKDGAVKPQQMVSVRRAWALLTDNIDVSDSDLPNSIQEISSRLSGTEN